MERQLLQVTRHLSALLLLLLVAGLKTFSAQDAYYREPFYSTYIEPIFDEDGMEVGDDQILELTDLKSTTLGIGRGHNYTFPLSSSQPEDPDLFVPQDFYTPISDSGQNIPRSAFDTERADYLSFPGRRFKRQARYHGGNSIGEHVFQAASHNGVFARKPATMSRGFGGVGNNRFDAGGTFGQFPSAPFVGTERSKRCAPVKEMSCNPRAIYRTIDGSCNNLAHPKWGAINQPIRRLLPAVYFDGYDVPRLTSTTDHRRLLPSARLVSRNIHEPAALQGHNLPDLTNLLQVWGQFLDHDITGTPAHKGPDGRDLRCCDGVYLTHNQQIHRDAFDGGRCNPIFIPPGDRHFTYSCMNFARSIAAKRKRDCDQNAPKEIRQQMNMLTAWVDASQVYGSTMKKADELRAYRKGLLMVSEGNMLPEDRNSTCVKEDLGDYCFLAGEKRINEHAALMALHIVFHRYHNEMAIKLSRMNPRWTDETIYQEVRRVMGAIMQHLTYHDWLPAVLGPRIMREYSLSVLSVGNFGPSFWRYDSKTDPTITNAFATAAFRFGHTMVPSLFTMGDVKVRLFTMFNRPKFILRDRGEGLRKVCAGMMHDPAHHCDRFMSTDLSDRLFEDRNNVSMDLASLNIHRARDHGLPSYNEYRKYCGLPVYKSFRDMHRSEPKRAEMFRSVYDDVNDIDLFAGGLSEKPLAGAVVGPTFACLLALQFHNIKFADRFWYEAPNGPGAFTPAQLGELRKITLSRIMCKTANMHRVAVNPLYKIGAFLPRGVQLPNGVFVRQNHQMHCEDLPEIDFSPWYDPNAQI